MKKFCILVVAVLTFSARADYLVWNTGAVLKIAESYTELNLANSAVAVTVLDGKGKAAAVYITKESVNWEKTASYNSGNMPADEYRESTISVIDLKQENSHQKGDSYTQTSEGLSLIEENASLTFGQLFIDGKIRNNMRKKASNIILSVDYFDGYDRLLGAQKLPLNPSELNGGEDCSFRIMAPRTPAGARISRYEINISWD